MIITIDTTQLAYDDQGSGVPVILLQAHVQPCHLGTGRQASR